MIFYNCNKVLRYSKKSTKEFLRIMHYITFPRIPETQKDKVYKYYQHNWRGKNFLINPESLFRNRYKHPDIDIARYIILAKYRNYGDYKLLGKTTLDLLAFKEKEALIKQNSLLRIKNGEIHFLYEEANPKEN